MGEAAWPFLIGRTRTEDHRIVVVPEFMTDPPLASALRASVIGDPMEPDSAAAHEIQVAPGQVITVVYRVSIARPESYGIPGEPGEDTLTDSHGRPILITEGLVLRRAAPDVMRSGVPQAALDRAHALVTPAYQAFWTEERQFTRQVSHAFPVTLTGSPRVRIRYRPDAPLLLTEPQPPQPQHPDPAPEPRAQVDSARYRHQSRPAPLALIVVAVATVIAATAGAGLFAVGPFSQPRTGNSQSVQPASSGTRPTASPVITACAAGSLTLIGSTAFMPIAQAAAAEYIHECKDSQIRVEGGDSAYGLTQLLAQVNAHSTQAGSTIAMYDGLPSPTFTAGLVPDPIGVLVLSVVAHIGLFPGSNVTTAELRTIFVKHDDPGVVAVGRRAGSSDRNAFIMTVLKQDPGPPSQYGCLPPAGQTTCTAASTADVLSFVNETPNAIGYAEASDRLVGYPEVSVISIDNAAPTIGNVRNGSYDFWAIEHLYSAAHPTALAKDFLNFLPHYIESHPLTGFIACSSAPRLAADC
jgi:ABC-type phosphate transport system substrate-binding protein